MDTAFARSLTGAGIVILSALLRDRGDAEADLIASPHNFSIDDGRHGPATEQRRNHRRGTKHKGPSGLLLGLPLSGKAATLDFLKGTGRSVFDRREDWRQVFLEVVPVDGRQDHYCNTSAGKVLLVKKWSGRR